MVIQTVVTTVAVTTLNPQSTSGSGSQATTQSGSTQIIESVYTTVIISTTVSPSSSTSGSNAKGSSSGSDSTSGSKKKGFWQSKGKVAGTFVVVGLVILLLILLLLYLFYFKPRNEIKKQSEFERTYNEIIQSNLRDSLENDSQKTAGVVAVNNALRGFQEFDSDVSSSNMNEKQQQQFGGKYGFDSSAGAAAGAGGVVRTGTSRTASHSRQDSQNTFTDMKNMRDQDFNPDYEMLDENDERITNDNLMMYHGDHDDYSHEDDYEDDEDYRENEVYTNNGEGGEGNMSTDDIMLPPRMSLGALKVVNKSQSTIDKVDTDNEQ